MYMFGLQSWICCLVILMICIGGIRAMLYQVILQEDINPIRDNECVLPDNLYLTLRPFPKSGSRSNIFSIDLHLEADLEQPDFGTTYLLNKLNGDIQNGTTNRRSQIQNKPSRLYTAKGDTARLLVKCQQDTDTNLSIIVSGILVMNNVEYIAQPDRSKPVLETTLDKGTSLVRLDKLSNIPSQAGIHLSEKSILYNKRLKKGRWRRDAVDLVQFTVEVLAVVDYTIFVKWKAKTDASSIARDDDVIKREIQEYYLHVINGVDLRFSNIHFKDFKIRVMLAGVIVLGAPGPYQWTQSDTTSGPRDKLEAGDTLNNFREWINVTEGLPVHDHAILYTGHDLFTQGESTEDQMSQTSGLAYINTLCNHGDSVSVVEEPGGFQGIGTTAHEIGHSLGALHDGENNTCRSDDRYIMAASGFGPVPDEVKLNPWLFSNCSIEYFYQFIATLIAKGSTCLQSPGSVTMEIGVPEVADSRESRRLPGQIYTPDQQCQLIWGPGSYLCRGSEFGNASTICTAMYCRDPSSKSDCVLHTAAPGTTCGHKQWCTQGQCEDSREAPAARGPCILGDQPGPAFNGLTCPQLVSQSPSFCYQDKVRARCCSSCTNVSASVAGCEYGDRIKGCEPWHCDLHVGPRNIRHDCCHTCQIGEVKLSTYNLSSLYDPGSTSTTVKPANENPCSDRGSKHEGSCLDLVNKFGRHICYSPIMEKECCQTCNLVNISISFDCRYGDRTPSLCARISNMTQLTCASHGSFCCQSCRHVVSSHATSLRHNTRIITTIIAMLIFCSYHNFLMMS